MVGNNGIRPPGARILGSRGSCGEPRTLPKFPRPLGGSVFSNLSIEGNRTIELDRVAIPSWPAVGNDVVSCAIREKRSSVCDNGVQTEFALLLAVQLLLSPPESPVVKFGKLKLYVGA